jgi:molybdate transport system ATP-binding protein
VIAGLRGRATGTVRFRGAPWLDSAARRCLPPERRGIGYVPQDGRLFPHLTVRDNLLFGSARARRGGVDIARQVARVADLLELAPLLAHDAMTLSGGERQRVALARALCSEPALLLLDEPFGALDRSLRRRLLPLLDRVCRHARLPVLLVSHDPAELRAVATDAIELVGGRVVGQGAPAELLLRSELAGTAGEAGFENLWIARATRLDAELLEVQLAEGVEIVTAGRGASPGDEVVVSLSARDVMLAVEPPRGLSARNVHPGRITRIDGERRRLVTTELAPGISVVAELSAAACAALALEVGRAVTVVFKASACRTHAAR